MGQLVERLKWIWDSFHQETSIVILGLDNAGKTATLYALQLGEALPYTVPTIGFNVEAIRVGHLDIKMWDVGGQDSLRELWPHYFEQSDGVAFVIDSADRDRFEKVRAEIHALVSHKDLAGKPLLVLANKQDLPSAASKGELIDILNLNSIKSSQWYIVECCAIQNDRAKVGFEWLANQL